MIRARIRSYGSRMVVLLAEPTHPALAALPRARSERAPWADFSDALARVVCDLSRVFAARLLSARPEPIRKLAD